MFLKRVWLLVILLVAILLVALFFSLHQEDLLFRIASIYWIICTLLWGTFFVFLSVKQLRQARQKGKYLRWNQSLFIGIGLAITMPSVLNVSLWQGEGQIGHTSWPIVNTIEVIVVAVFLVCLLFFEVILTVGCIRSFGKTINPSVQSPEIHSPEE